MSAAAPPVTFALGMASSSGSPPFLVLHFDDGAAVSLNSVRVLAAERGLEARASTLFDLLQAWDPALAGLAETANALAYDDRARGYRGHFAPADIFTTERLIPEARQIFRIEGDICDCLPITVQGMAAGRLTLDDRLREARLGFALAAVIGRACHLADEATAAAAIAGWTLAVELLRLEGGERLCRHLPGTLVLGPTMVPRVFARQLEDIEYCFAPIGGPFVRGTLEPFARQAPGAISRLSRNCLLLPGDVVLVAGKPDENAAVAGGADVLDMSAPGFGRLRVSLQ